jgi:hypothetical protein
VSRRTPNGTSTATCFPPAASSWLTTSVTSTGPRHRQ